MFLLFLGSAVKLDDQVNLLDLTDAVFETNRGQSLELLAKAETRCTRCTFRDNDGVLPFSFEMEHLFSFLKPPRI